MNAIFTVCAQNYLPQALTMFQSCRRQNPGYRFFVGLIDRPIPEDEFSELQTGAEIFCFEKKPFPGFRELADRYALVELATAVKPFVFQDLFARPERFDCIFYVDPDVYIYQPFTELEKSLQTSQMILTPHLTRPIPNDSLLPGERQIFRTGVFNLGFLGLSRGDETSAFLNWWREKCEKECYLDLSQGLFVDQIWLNLAPAFYSQVLVERSPIYNAAHWNLHERIFENRSGVNFVNGKPLCFYHFSHFNPTSPGIIAKYHTRYSFETRPDIKPLYETYAEQLMKNGFLKWHKKPCFFAKGDFLKFIRSSLFSALRNYLPVKSKIFLGNLRSALFKK